jgi:C_GCAxxG_C_C family probable redox protein
MKPSEKAVETFKAGNNCAQAVLSTYCDYFNINPEVAMKLTSSLGAGLNRQDSLCGALLGGIILIGLSNNDLERQYSREKNHEEVSNFFGSFKEQCGSTNCTELLGYNLSHSEEYKQAREDNIFPKVCPEYVRAAAEIFETIYQNNILSRANEAIINILAKSEDTIETIILDQWRVAEKRGQWRLTYGGYYIENCDNKCETCKVYSATGGEDIKGNSQFRTTLVKATEDDINNYDGKQVHLNCKTTDQYVNSFISCFVNDPECIKEEDVSHELDYLNFKLIYMKNVDEKDLPIEEKKIKDKIIQGVIKNKEYENRKELFISLAKEKGLL